MKKNKICLTVSLIFILELCVVDSLLHGETSVNYLPQTPAYSSNVSSIVYQGVSQGQRLAAVSLQGLVNRDTARIYLIEKKSEWLLDLYKEKGIIKTEKNYTNIYTLLKDYKKYFKGVVVFDPTKSFTVNLASNIAGVEDRIILSPDMLSNFMRFLDPDVNIKDLRDFDFEDNLSAYNWYEKNILPLQPKTILSVAKDLYMHDVYRDYLIQFKIPTFWLPGKNDADYNLEYENKIINLFSTTPPNIPVLGFWPAVDASGKNVGYEEFDGVKLAGKYGKFTLVNTWVGNYSFHSAINSSHASYKQQKVRAKKFRTYDPTKKYVALIMSESGDAPCYYQYGITQRQWNDPYRGQVPISYGITPSLIFLMPEVTKYLYDTATENDFFFNSISGAGYCYPFEGYCDLTADPAKNKKDYFSITAENMLSMDMDMIGLYTHSGSKWTVADKQIAKTYIEPMKGLKSIISGMHRTGYTGADGNEIMDSITIHHTLTFWPSIDYTWDDISKDQSAVDFMENEIKTYGAGGNFIQAMFYSWMYGPRRLKMLKDRMESQGYEFVTLNEFDYLCRISNGWKLIKDVSNSTIELKNHKILNYPNPTSGIVNFVETINGKINCFDNLGRLTKTFNVNDTRQIDLTSLAKGIYYIQVQLSLSNLLLKVVVI